MPNPDQNTHEQVQPKPTLDLAELQRQMEALQAKVAEAQQEKEKKQAEAKEQIIGEKVGEMESTYTEGKKVESELEETNQKIASAEKVLEQFSQVAEQAKALGMDVSSQHEGFTKSLEDEKDRLAQLQNKQAELQEKVKELGGDTEVMERIQEEAIKENAKKSATEDNKEKETTLSYSEQADKNQLDSFEQQMMLTEREIAEANKCLDADLIESAGYRIKNLYFPDEILGYELKHLADKGGLHGPKIQVDLQRLENLRISYKQTMDRYDDASRMVKEGIRGPAKTVRAETTRESVLSEASERTRRELEIVEGHFQKLDEDLSNAETAISGVESLPAGSREKYDAAFAMRSQVEDIFFADATVRVKLEFASDDRPYPPEVRSAMQKLEDLRIKYKDTKDRAMSVWREAKDEYLRTIK